jgi:1-deoxy-D-xylulose-5-phosphate synthase
MRTVPNMVIMTPADENECRQMLYTGYLHQGPAAVRYPRGSGRGAEIDATMTALDIGKGRRLRQGSKLALLNFGTLLPEAEAAAETLNATLVDMRFVKPLDEALVLALAADHELLVTVEENAIMGGAGSAVNECLMRHKKPVLVLNLGLPDTFIEQGSQQQIWAKLGLDAAGITQAVRDYQAR